MLKSTVDDCSTSLLSFSSRSISREVANSLLAYWHKLEQGRSSYSKRVPSALGSPQRVACGFNARREDGNVVGSGGGTIYDVKAKTGTRQ